MRYEEQHYHKINTQSITKYMNVKTSHSPFRSENDKHRVENGIK